MKQVIYIDVLIFVNLIVNYFLILATAKFLYLKLRPFRLILGELLGGIYSLYILIPDLPIFVSFGIRLFMAGTIVGVIFGFKNIKVFVKSMVYFFLVSFAFSGIMFFLWYFLRPNGMAINNGVVYFGISPIVLIISTVVSYVIIEVTGRILEKRENKNLICRVFLKIGEKKADFVAKVDTCNYLTEPFSNLPVIIASSDVLGGILPENLSSDSESFLQSTKENNLKLRFIPFKTVSGEGLLPAFKPDSLKIGSSGVNKEAYVAVCKKEILPPGVEGLVNPLLVD